jgi:hypothetical protein
MVSSESTSGRLACSGGKADRPPAIDASVQQRFVQSLQVPGATGAWQNPFLLRRLAVEVDRWSRPTAIRPANIRV